MFIDGGADFYGGALMREYGIIHDDLPGWQRLIQRWDLGILLVNPKAPIASEVMHDGGWRYWYCDATAVLLVRNDVVPANIRPATTFDLAACVPKPGPDPST